MLVCYFPHLLTGGILMGWIHRTLRADWPDSVHMLNGWSFALLLGLELETCLLAKFFPSRYVDLTSAAPLLRPFLP